MKYSAWMRRIATLLASLTCLGGVCILPAHAAEANDAETYEAKKAAYREQIMADDVTTDDFLIGAWVSFYSFETDSFEKQLDRMAAAGMNFNTTNLNPYEHYEMSANMTEAEYWNEVERQYAAHNMVYHIRNSSVELAVEYAAGKEHCVGYHLLDEPGGDALQWVAESVAVYREADPTRYPFVNLNPSYAGEDWLGGTYYEYVSRFVELTGAENIEYLSHDFYPFQEGVSKNNTDIFADMEVIRDVAYKNGKLKTHAFPQSTAWNGMRMPNIDEMRWNVYAYLAYGFKALSWFNLVCPGASDTEGEGFYDCLIYRDGTIRNPELFAAWSELNWEIRGMSSILMNLDAAHAYHVKANVDGVEKLPEDFFLQPANRYDFVISVMEPKEGDDEYIMIFNKNSRREAKGEFTVDPASGVKWVEYFDPHIGEYIPMELEDGMLKDSYLVGEGKLYRLRYDTPPSETEETEETTEPTETTAEVPTESATNATTEATGTAPETNGKPSADGGCSSVVGFGATMVSAIAAAVVVYRKKEE